MILPGSKTSNASAMLLKVDMSNRQMSRSLELHNKVWVSDIHFGMYRDGLKDMRMDEITKGVHVIEKKRSGPNTESWRTLRIIN